MPTSDIIDNRKELLVDHIKRILPSCEAARFAIGYFFLSGFESIAKELDSLRELRLLIGNTTNRETLEQIAEGYRRLESAQREVESLNFPKRTESRRMVAEAADNVRESIELMEQTDDAENLIGNLSRMIEEGRLKVRVYTKGMLHAKAYVFDYREDGRYEKGIAITGSSNFTLSGLRHNTELNVVVHGNGNHAALSGWFEELWNESEEFDEALMREMKSSWAARPASPYDVYMKTLYTLVKDRLEGEDDREILWQDEITTRLAEFQKIAVYQALQMIKDYGGAFVSDVVGLGKSFIGAAIVKHFERTQHARPLIICPAPLVEMWECYNEVYALNARVVSMGLLRDSYLRETQDSEELSAFNSLLAKYPDRDFVLIDESHNLRHSDTQRYKIVQTFLSTGKRCCLLTATPRNKSAWDVYHQIKLFHQDDLTTLPVEPPNLKDYFRMIENGERQLPSLLANILVRRTRNHILRWYGYDAETNEPLDPTRFQDYASGKRRAYVLVGDRHQFFPKRELETIEYSIEETYKGIYERLRGFLGKAKKNTKEKNAKQAFRKLSDELTYARYGLWHYLKAEKAKQEPYTNLQRAGANLRGLIRVLLFKRFESSVYAFRETVRRLLRAHETFNKALSQNIIPAGDDAQAILYEPNDAEEKDLMDALREVSIKYRAEDFQLDKLKAHIEHDIEILRTMLELVEPITPDKDVKLQTLKQRLLQSPLVEQKKLIFTQYADTARYLYENLNPNDERKDIDVIYSSGKKKSRIAGRFAPCANPEYVFQAGDEELNTVIATDVLSEGLNLQDCNVIINYDLHWNPVRLIQRFGRVDRICTQHDNVYGFNFLPERGIDRNLSLRDRLHNRIQEIHNTIGEDAAILDQTERLNEEAMYAIYEQRSGQLSLFEDEDEYLDLNEAEEILRALRRENKSEYERIASLRDGIRSARLSFEQGTFVFCQSGRYQQLYLLDANSEVVTRETPHVLGLLKCPQETPTESLPQGYNNRVNNVLKQFTEEAKKRQSELAHTQSLTHGQHYALRELRLMFSQTVDDDLKGQINILEKALRGPITTAIARELNLLRRNNVVGEHLLKSLSNLYYTHRMDTLAARRIKEDATIAPHIICSEAFV
jgi:superfamily II DNA/RNA helicase